VKDANPAHGSPKVRAPRTWDALFSVVGALRPTS
jgi:hypothetical protein